MRPAVHNRRALRKYFEQHGKPVSSRPSQSQVHLRSAACSLFLEDGRRYAVPSAISCASALIGLYLNVAQITP